MSYEKVATNPPQGDCTDRTRSGCKSTFAATALIFAFVTLTPVFLALKSSGQTQPLERSLQTATLKTLETAYLAKASANNAPKDIIMLSKLAPPEQVRLTLGYPVEIENPWSVEAQNQRIQQLNRAYFDYYNQRLQSIVNQRRSSTEADIRSLSAFLSSDFFKDEPGKTYFFIKHAQERLPEYLPWFKQAAEQHELDWRLLAAIAYQESLWNPNAVSPTGVKGLMMLTRVTASEMGVTDRTDPKQSIFGGAAYFKKIHQRLPRAIQEPDRTKMALAAYNAGYGHLVDARKLTRRHGGTMTKWQDVKKHLPLLQDPDYYVETTHGYSTGARQAIHYVKKVGYFYEMLVASAVQHEPFETFRTRPTPPQDAEDLKLAMF